jgi:hypothetical protein
MLIMISCGLQILQIDRVTVGRSLNLNVNNELIAVVKQKIDPSKANLNED